MECHIYSTCPSISNALCTNCYTGEKACELDSLCHVPGKCEDGYFLGFYPEESYDECRKLCEEMTDCKWFSQVCNDNLHEIIIKLYGIRNSS